jgi:hypothetical protein
MWRRKEFYAFVLGVLASIIGNIIYAPLALYVDILTLFAAFAFFASILCVCFVLRKYLIKAAQLFYGAILKISALVKKAYSSFMEIYFLAEIKRIVSSSAITVISCVFEFAFDILPKILLLGGFIYAVGYVGKHHIPGHRSVTATECNCPKSTKSNYVSYPTTYSYSQPYSDYILSYNTRLSYQKLVSNSTGTTVVAADCFSGQKSKKNKAAEKFCAIITPASAAGYTYSQNSLGLKDAEPQ